MFKKFTLSAAVMAVLASTLVLLPALSGVAGAAQPVPGHTKLAPEAPRTTMPRINDGEIFDLEYIGDRVFVVGSFTSIRNATATNTTSYAQRYVASFNLTTGLVDATFRPTFDNLVNEIEASPDGTKLYVVGKFNTVNGVTKRKVASINPTTGAPVTGFTAAANGQATSVEATNSTVYIGGQFTTINSTARVGLAAVNASTGAVVTGFRNDLSGGIGVNGDLKVQALSLTPDESKLLVVHTARQIAGQDRYGVGLISTSTNLLLPWSTDLWKDNLQFVGGIQRAVAGAISPNGQYFVVTSGSGGDRPPINDTAVAFSVDGGAGMQPRWVSRLFDSVYSVAISEQAVYLGGHFAWNESPSARDPWPGLDDVGYGTGQGLSGYGLGDDVVRRDHVGALDPATGKALEWNPGSNSYEGNKAMLVHPRGVITGGDATTQGGYNVGRIAYYDFSSVAAPGANETTIVDPIAGRVKAAGQPFTISGGATATSGVRSVSLELIDSATKRYLQDDLTTWSTTWNSINANLAAPNATSTTWSLPLTVTGNRAITIQARTVAVNGTNDATKAIKKFETFGLSDLTPTTSVTGPIGVQSALTFTVTGTASDDFGVSNIRFTVRDLAGRYLQEDGSTDGAYNAFSVRPDVIGAQSATWSYDLTLPYESEWTMQAFAVDTAGQSALDSANRTWIVSANAIEPTVAITAPTPMLPPTAAFPLTVAPGGPITFAGSAIDDTRLANVEIQLQNTTTRERLASDGTWAADATLGWYRLLPVGYNGSSFNWSYTTPFNLKPGTYTFSVRATDNLGITTSTANRGSLTINAQVPGDTFPDTTMTTSGTVTGLQSLTIDLSGTATDAQGVAAVGLSVRDRDSGLYVQPNGTKAVNYAVLPTTLATPGGTSTVWTRTLTLPTIGDYDVIAFSTDTAGQQDPLSTGATARFLLYPGDNPPVLTESLLAPTEGTAFTNSRIITSGRVEDDQQIRQVQVAIRNNLGQYMSSTGTFTSTTESWRTAFLNSPGTPGSNFSYTTPAIPAGAYTVLFRGVDQNDQVTAVPSVRNVTVNAPASNLAPVAKFTYSCAANKCTFDARTSTDENAAAMTYSWSWGTTPATTSTGPVPVKYFSSAGTFTVTLTARDEYGITSTTSQQVTIVEPPTNTAPTAVINTPSCAGLVCNFSAVGSLDANVGDTITYLWNFGDGQPTSTASAVAKTYLAAGTYTVTLTVTDGWGKATTVTRQVTVSAV